MIESHHKRTRSSGEQRGITGNMSAADEVTAQPSGQVRAKTGPECSQLPKLRARAVVTGRPFDGNGSVAEAGGGAARHTRAWSVS
ncbi:hypothetical protein GCM10010383_68340 [Streptomyces lomondensis]|uniref:Uncharacterized protein n=1 Tax=Streptomyces lomondensis TaxID=68229 RepID=A0ABQ2XQP9_9ACTN|nr:hypothetical protein GCM10010383_68340 [Streptomyces lomondensis]